MKKLICIMLAVLLLTGCAGGAAPEAAELKANIQGEEITYQAWEKDGLPTEGSYYLTREVEIAQAVTVSGELNLHLNGHSIVAAHDTIMGHMFVIPAGSRMTVYDTPVEDPFASFDNEEPEEFELELVTGTIVSNRSFSGKMTISSMFKVEGELVMAGGHIDASPINLEDRANGSAINVRSGGHFDMVGGVITGGTTWRFAVEKPLAETETSALSGTPATTTPDATTTTPDGTAPTETTAPVETTAPAVTEPVIEIANETLGRGGAVYIDKGASATMSGGTIWKGSACEGGNFYVAGDEEGSGQLTILGGVLLYGEAVMAGGNVYVAGKMDMSDGTMLWGRSYCDGGNLFLSGQLNITGGKLEGGACDVNAKGYKYGGNIAVNGINATVSITNTEILDGTAACKESHGGNISIVRYGAKEFEVGEGTKIIGGLGHRGGNVYVGHFAKDIPLENTDYVFTKVEMSGGTTTYRGANMCSDTKDTTRPIQVTFNDCNMIVDNAGERSLAIGAGAKDVSQCIIVINGGTFTGGEIHIYGSSTVTSNGTKFVDCPVGGTGIYTENP